MLLKPRVTFQQERVAFLQQQLQKEEETAAAAKTRLEQAQASRIAAEEELAKQEALFAEKQVIPPPASCIRYSTDSSCENWIKKGFPLTHTHTHTQIRIQEADLMLTRGRSVQESVKGALSELESVVRKLQVPGLQASSCRHDALTTTIQDTKRAKDAAASDLESQLSDVLARRCASPL